MISGGRRYKHTTCEPHSHSLRQSQSCMISGGRRYNLWTSLNSLRKSCMISGGRRYKHITCEPHSTVSDRAVWSVEADDTNTQLVNLTHVSDRASQAELYDQWRQTIQTHNLWTSLYSLRQSCVISGGRYNLWITLQSQTELYDQWRQTIQTYNLWTSLCSLRQSCMISGGRRYKHTTCEPHSTVSERAVWSVEADDTNIQLVNLTLQSQAELYDQWRQTIQTYNL